MVTPSALAVFRLIAISNSVGCWTGKSLGLAPFRMPAPAALCPRQLPQCERLFRPRCRTRRANSDHWLARNAAARPARDNTMPLAGIAERISSFRPDQGPPIEMKESSLWPLSRSV
jgi:hypothetical protein